MNTQTNNNVAYNEAIKAVNSNALFFGLTEAQIAKMAELLKAKVKGNDEIRIMGNNDEFIVLSIVRMNENGHAYLCDTKFARNGEILNVVEFGA